MAAVCIDLDGTLTNPELGITRCIRYALAEIGRDVADDVDLRWCIGPPLQGSLERLLGDAKDAEISGFNPGLDHAFQMPKAIAIAVL